MNTDHKNKPCSLSSKNVKTTTDLKASPFSTSLNLDKIKAKKTKIYRLI